MIRNRFHDALTVAFVLSASLAQAEDKPSEPSLSAPTTPVEAPVMDDDDPEDASKSQAVDD